MAALRYLKKALGPRIAIAALTARGLARATAKVRRILGRRGRIELYFAFDDPYSALALPDLITVVEGRQVELVVYPLVERGVVGDQGADTRRRYSLVDAKRLAARDGRQLARSGVVAPNETSLVAAWAESLSGDARVSLCAHMLCAIWMDDIDLSPTSLASAYADCVGDPPPVDSSAAARGVTSNERSLIKRGHWESPAARIAGEWFFAHERIPQIGDCLDELGWRR